MVQQLYEKGRSTRSQNIPTRPIDYYSFHKILDSPGFDTAEDPEIKFASTMRAPLSEVAKPVSLSRLDNLHKRLDILGTPIQHIVSETKPLKKQDALDALIAKN
ncbi:hypothetical protein AYI69_g3376 [Smittium culicis]|uniref:Uncharacterized protein n=1 Tax=Smittium culicis TaxID=133412 RepID=A0A1R1YK06_9FUNG|nr:hypothetical protein AYI69_g3376 [Smittium culicis]